MQDLNKIKETFWKDGFVHLKSIFKKKEMQDLRKFVLNNKSKNIINENFIDIMMIEKFNKYLINDKVINIVRAILENTPIYFGDSSVTIAKKHNIGIYHKDCTDRLDPKAPDWKTNYPLLRIGLFLQNHNKHSGGIILGKCSHNILFKNRFLQILYEEVYGFITGKFRHCDSEIGDLVIWNLRTTHGPMGKRLKFFFRRPISKRLDKFIPNFLKHTFFGSRILVTATFGSKSSHLDRYISYLKTRNYMVNKWVKNSYNTRLKKLLSNRGVVLYDLQKEVKKELKSKKIIPTDKWMPYPY